MKQHKHGLPPGVKLNNMEQFKDEYDFGAMSHGQRHGRISGRQEFTTDRNVSPMTLYAMQMDRINIFFFFFFNAQ
jgi:hypothetical protein